MRLYKVQLATEMGWADLKGFVDGTWKTLAFESSGEAYEQRDWAISQELARVGRVVDSRAEEEVDLYWSEGNTNKGNK
jgi:hypothetical protein